MVRHRIPFFLVFEVIHAGFDVDFFQKVLNPLGVTADWKSLPGVVEIVVVVLKSERQAFDDAGRKLFAISAPLLLGVAFDELLVDRAANEFDGLLFEVLWFIDVFLLNLFGNLGLRFFGGCDAPKLMEGVHVERHVVELAMAVGDRRVDERINLNVLIEHIPSELV